MISDIVGWIGAVLVIIAYFLVSTKKLPPPQSRTYQIINLLGAIGVGFNVFVQRAYPSLAIQMAWAMVAIYGIYKASKQ